MIQKFTFVRTVMLASLVIFMTSSVFAQAVITGKVIDSTSGEGLIGASVTVDGTSLGTTSDIDGNYSISNAPTGKQKLVVSFIGFSKKELLVDLVSGKNQIPNVTLEEDENMLSEIVVTSRVIDFARTRETPIAVSTISPQEIALKIGNLEFPEVLSRTPGVYATKTGGGYGDSRISLRGFDQSNTSFLINGQPVNDMENGWVYWSNWQGLTDVASGIQVQRGLGASRLAVPSVGGTVSIFTKAAERKKGGGIAQSFGNNGYSKTTANYSSGKSDKGWASSFLVSYWKGDGYAYGTAGEGWTYFGAVGYQPEGSKHSINLSVLGAAQWHHQRSSWISIRDYQNFGTPQKDGIDRRWNTDAGFLNGEEFNMRRNFYNKPLATVNWDWDISSNLQLNTSLYGSAGRGGGTGPRGGNFRNGDIDYYPFNIDLTTQYNERGRGTRDANGFINFDKAIDVNRSTTDPYTGANSNFTGQLLGSNGFRDDGVNRAVLVRRASMNSHDWIGAISSLEGQFDKVRASIGVDLRSYKGYHYRVLNNLMGLDGYYSTGNRNSNGQVINTLIEASPFNNTGLNGPKIDYYNIGVVGWQGANGLLEYVDTKLTGVLQAGISNQSFQREDYFDQPAMPISEKKSMTGGYVKGGANFNFTETSNVFFNAGFISRQPQFDAVFPNFANNISPDVQNEKITSFELGYGFIGKKVTVNLNAYATTWGNRFRTASVFNTQGDQGTAQFKDIDVQHNGIELEATYRPMDKLKLQFMGSLGDWRYTKDFTAELFDNSNNSIGTGTLYLKDAKVGNAAQTTAAVNADYNLNKVFSVDLGYRYAGNLYADYSIVDDSFAQPNNPGALKLPSYSLVDAGATARFKLLGNTATFRLNVNNLFDALYISESQTNIHAEGNSVTWNGIDVRNSVWLGFGRTWNASLKYSF
ncbi:Outer membrane receptor proteins, mostly Fe transport [Spirosomataceae bacterium TFI 002]|nr:Outer membrane receptor proteins, mostly Fe transport [Spirosomataceae bacterium TFI 002]